MLFDDVRAANAPMVEHARFDCGKDDGKQEMGLVGGKCRYVRCRDGKKLSYLCSIELNVVVADLRLVAVSYNEESE